MTLYRTAESVSPRHPDKLCDQLSDAIVDAYLRVDPQSRLAVEVAGGHGKLMVFGEVTSHGQVDIAPIVQRVVGDIEVDVQLAQQSPEIAHGVDNGGAGDQGIMVGYACDGPNACRQVVCHVGSTSTCTLSGHSMARHK